VNAEKGLATRPAGLARAALLVALVLSSSLAHGEEAPPAPSGEPEWAELQGLLNEPLVSTASDALQLASAAPATSRSISADELRRHGIRSLDEAINFLGLGMVTQNPLHSVDVGARGVLMTADFGNHVLLLLNGHTLNEPWDGTAYFERGAAIPFELIDHIEIVLGPGSVLYGSNAMLGVVNVITKKSDAWRGVHLIAESELLTSGRVAVGGAGELSLFGRTASFIAEAEYYRQSGPTFTFGPQLYGNDAVTGQPKKFDPAGTNAGIWGGAASRAYFTEIPAAFANLTVGRWALDLRAATYKRGTPAINGFNQAIGDFNDASNWERDRWLSFDSRHTVDLSTRVELFTHVYGDLYQFEQRARTSAPEDCQPGQAEGCVHITHGRSRWIGLEERLSTDWAHDGRWTTLVGVDGRLRSTGQDVQVVDVVTGLAPQAEGLDRLEHNLGVYLQQMAHPARRVDLNAGVRMDLDSRFGPHLSPRAAVLVSPWTGGTLKGIFSSAFRAPTLYEHAFSDPASQIPATSLRPEDVRSVEALFEQRLGSQHLLLGVFRSWWTDMVALQTLTPDEVAAAQSRGDLLATTSTATQYRNVAGIDDVGFDMATDGSSWSGDLRYGGSVTAAWAHQNPGDGTSLDLTVTPKVFGNARVSYDLPGEAPVLGLAVAFFGRRLADRAHDGGFEPPPAVPASADLRLSVTGPLPGLRGLSYRLTAGLSTATHAPYVVGPLQAATPNQSRAELTPVDRFRAGVGLQYDFGAGR